MYLKTLLTIGLPSATLAIGKSPLRHHLQPRIATELVMCTADWMPVCGSDGNVYGNACEAEAAGSEVMYEIEAPGDDLAPGDNCFAPLGPTWHARTYLNASGVLVDVAENTSITLKFENGTFGGSSSCNKYQNAFTNATNASFAVGDQLSLTMMMCDEELMSQEREYLAIFNGTLTYAVYGDSIGLELADDSGKVVAQYAAQADPPAICTMDWRPVCGSDGKVYGNACEAEVAGLEAMYEIESPDSGLATGDSCFAAVGRTWNAQMYLNASGALVDVAANSFITLKFDNGTFSGSSSCNKYRGTYANATNASFAVGDQLSSSMMMCEEELMSQEQDYLAIFNGTVAYSVSEDPTGLELTDSAGNVLAIYVTEADAPAPSNSKGQAAQAFLSEQEEDEKSSAVTVGTSIATATLAVVILIAIS